MNPTVSSSRRPRGWVGTCLLGALALTLGTMVVIPLLVPAVIYLSFRPTGDLTALRASVGQATGVELEREIELAVRPMAFALVRAGAVVAGLPAEARAALGAVRGAEVGLYQVSAAPRAGGPTGLLAEVDRTMARRGWDRIVAVVDGRQMVAVFAPQDIRSSRDLSLAVLVFDGSQVVLASVRGDPEALADLALEQAQLQRRPHLAVGAVSRDPVATGAGKRLRVAPDGALVTR